MLQRKNLCNKLNYSVLKMGHAKSFCKYSISNSVVREFLAEFLGEYLGYIYSFSSGANFR